MSRFSMRKTLTGIAIAALATSGLVMTAGTASADATHPSAATVNSSNVRITKSIVGDGEVAPGGKVTVRTVISTTGHPERYVDQFVDRYPAHVQVHPGHGDGQRVALDRRSEDRIRHAFG